MAVPGCPLFAAWGPSIAIPRMVLMARCSTDSGPTALTLSVRGRLAEQGDRGGEAVQEAAAPDGAELARAEHPGRRAAVGDGAEGGRIVVRSAEQLDATAVAGEQQRRRGIAPVEQGPQVLVRRRRVTHLELHGGAHL